MCVPRESCDYPGNFHACTLIKGPGVWQVQQVLLGIRFLFQTEVCENTCVCVFDCMCGINGCILLICVTLNDPQATRQRKHGVCVCLDSYLCLKAFCIIDNVSVCAVERVSYVVV